MRGRHSSFLLGLSSAMALVRTNPVRTKNWYEPKQNTVLPHEAADEQFRMLLGYEKEREARSLLGFEKDRQASRSPSLAAVE